jgi:NADH-quinone oxidoreductase subunit G
VGVIPTAGPGYADADAGLGASEIARQLSVGELSAVYLLEADPLREQHDRVLWEVALDAATTVIAHADQMTTAVEEFATVVFPLEAYAEKEGTLTHPDGRVQRLRQSIGRPDRVLAGWHVIAEVAKRVGLDLGAPTAAAVSAQVFEAVPFYAGLTLEELGGRGVRWPEREQASSVPAGDTGPFELEPPSAASPVPGKLRVGRYRPLWASPEVEVSPTLRFLSAKQQVELSPADAQRFGVTQGQEVVVAANGHSVRGTAELRDAAPEGTVFLADGLEHDGANALGDEQAAEVRPA